MGILGSSQIITVGKTKVPKNPVLCLFLHRRWGDDLHFFFWLSFAAHGIIPAPPAVKRGVLTPGPPGKSLILNAHYGNWSLPMLYTALAGVLDKTERLP